MSQSPATMLSTWSLPQSPSSAGSSSSGCTRARKLSTPASGSGHAASQALIYGRFASRSRLRFDGGMPALTRRRSRDHRQECWLIYFGDMPGRSPSASAIRTTPRSGSGAAASIRDRTRATIRAAPPPASTRPAPTLRARGRTFCQSEPRADFQEWRDQRDWTAEKICAVGCRQKAGTPAPMILRPAPQRAQAGLISAPTSAFVGDRESIKLPPDPRERRVWTFIGFTSLVRADN
jgi:hypothetical protein